MKMRIRKIKRKCNVRGCKSTDTYAITKASEFGNSIIACRSCLEEALALISNAQQAEKAPVSEVNTEDAANIVSDETDAQQADSDKSDEYVCPVCRKEYKSEAAFLKHIEKCQGDGK